MTLSNCHVRRASNFRNSKRGSIMDRSKVNTIQTSGKYACVHEKGERERERQRETEDSIYIYIYIYRYMYIKHTNHWLNDSRAELKSVINNYKYKGKKGIIDIVSLSKTVDTFTCSTW